MEVEELKKKGATKTETEWKKIWKGGPTQTTIKERKILTAKRKKEDKSRKREEQEKEEKKSGTFLKKWIQKSSPEENPLRPTQPKRPGRIQEIKKKLGIQEENPVKKEEEEATSVKRKRFTDLRDRFEERKETPKKLRTFRPEIDKSWVDGKFGCNNVKPPEVLKKGYTKKAVEMKDEGRDEKERSSGSNLKTGIGVGRNKTAAVGPTGKKWGNLWGRETENWRVI